MKLQGKVAIITGGSSGIGKATALRFGAEGAAVGVVASSDLAKAQAVADEIIRAGGRAMALQINLRDVQTITPAFQKVVDAFGPVDILVNSAGVYIPTPVGGTSEELYDQIMDTNLKGMFFAIQAVAPAMKERRSGRIVNVASVAAFKGSARYPLYSTAKAAVAMMTRALALDLAPHNVAINAIAPGNTATPINEGDRASAEMVATKQATTPSVRVYSPPEEMAATILFLSTGEVSALHGSTFLLDEGLSA